MSTLSLLYCNVYLLRCTCKVYDNKPNEFKEATYPQMIKKGKTNLIFTIYQFWLGYIGLVVK